MNWKIKTSETQLAQDMDTKDLAKRTEKQGKGQCSLQRKRFKTN